MHIFCLHDVQDEAFKISRAPWLRVIRIPCKIHVASVSVARVPVTGGFARGRSDFIFATRTGRIRSEGYNFTTKMMEMFLMCLFCWKCNFDLGDSKNYTELMLNLLGNV